MMDKPHTLPNGKVIDIRQSFGNIPKPFMGHWLYGRVQHSKWLSFVDCDDVLYLRESASAWNLIADWCDDLERTRKKYGRVDINTYINRCHDEIYRVRNNPDRPLLLYKLYCHVQFFDLAIELGKRDFTMRPEFNNDRVYWHPDEFLYPTYSA